MKIPTHTNKNKLLFEKKRLIPIPLMNNLPRLCSNTPDLSCLNIIKTVPTGLVAGTMKPSKGGSAPASERVRPWSKRTLVLTSNET